MVKLVDTLASGASDLKQVLGVRVSPSAQNMLVDLLAQASTLASGASDLKQVLGVRVSLWAQY